MNIRQIEPARAKAKDPSLLWDNDSWIAEEKLDGWRFLMHVGRQLSRPHLTGRRVSSVTALYSEKGELARPLWPEWPECPYEYTVVDGEVMPPDGASFNDLASMMNSTPEVAAAAVARLGSPRYVVFDCLFVDGSDIRSKSLTLRQREMRLVVNRMGNDLVSCVDCAPPRREVFDRVIAAGGEGLILKHAESPYGEGWVKVKRVHTIDVVVTGFREAKFGRTGRIFGQVGSLEVSVYSSSGELIEVGNASGMDDATRRAITDDRDGWLGSVVEVEAQGWARDRLRHPRFKRRREDADPREATYRKMMEDLA
jgi:ATP-dependent DNA ligase